MELEDDDLGTMIVIYYPLEIEIPSSVELFTETAEPDPIQVSHRDPNDDFSDLNLDDIPEDIDEEVPVEGENGNPHSAGNISPGIVIRNNPGSFMTDVDPDAILLELRRFRQRFVRLESQMSSLPTNLWTWLGSIENWQWTQSYDEGFRYGQMTTNLIEVGHMYIEAIRKAMAVNSRRAQTMNAEMYSSDLETFQVQEYIGRHSGLLPRSYAVGLRNRRCKCGIFQTL
ncbi:hypothetical protein GOBAR_DD29306 [Gossypium barbadense]|nr:hypothetical protein GOBAR_DD29306 [Gossypium barbadense]